MPSCWTCSKSLPVFEFACNSCRSLKELQALRSTLSDQFGNIEAGLDRIEEVQLQGFLGLNERLDGIASILIWGFEELKWEIEKQTDVLRSIDKTLNSPSQTQAKEWRSMAEQLRNRKDLVKAEKFFLDSLDKNPLDYRTYVGLSMTYLQQHKLDECQEYYEHSLPHAVASRNVAYSYRMIGHVEACRGNFAAAAACLVKALDALSEYSDGQYDLAQYNSRIGRDIEAMTALHAAIVAKPLFWYLAQKEANSLPVKSSLLHLLRSMRTNEHKHV